MNSGYFLDNDVVIKSCAYGIIEDLRRIATFENIPPSILAVSRFTILNRIRRSKKLSNKGLALEAIEKFLAAVAALEPTQDEIVFAAEMEARATQLNMSFDTGESQIVAMMLQRSGVAFISGDKRAARAMCALLPHVERRVICLEQVLHSLIHTVGLFELRTAVCKEPLADKAVTFCFQCSLESLEVDAVFSALESYSSSLRAETGCLLILTNDMSGAKIP